MKIYKIPEPALLHLYQNGNYDVKIYSDGTKVRTTEDDEFIAQFPENIDCKITNKCDMGCAFCHENSVVDGLHGNINHPILSTSACITVLGTDGIYRSVYNHSDGYPDWLFNQLRTYFNSQELADWIVNHGDVSFLNQPVGLAIWDKNYDSPYKGEETDDKNASRFYCNRPGEEWNNIKAHEHASMEDVYMKYLGEYFDDYHYFWDGSKWRIVKVNHVDPLKVIYNEKEN